jgi:hypothetical protein
LKVQKIKFKQVGGIYAHLFLNGCPKNVYWIMNFRTLDIKSAMGSH